MSYQHDLEIALQLADLADEITLDRFEAADLNISTKPDLTPVTDADLACEKALRAKLAELAPSDQILGEEYGGQVAEQDRQWIIDPIDGTKNFVRGVPVWATLIALCENGEPVVGVVSAPAIGQRWYAAKEQGTWHVLGQKPAKKVQVSKVSQLADSSISFSDLLESEWTDPVRKRFLALTDQAWRLRAYGDFFSYCLLAQGSLEIALEPEVSPWDLAAVALIVTEAGGTFTSFAGQPGPFHGSALATNGLLHEQVLTALNS